ncbi:MAG TPA: hypothetical protein ENH85_07085 [Candidatus Scalindua sp.]|nr:hypothetical protein [Candidatus Scalindua sp.]
MGKTGIKGANIFDDTGNVKEGPHYDLIIDIPAITGIDKVRISKVGDVMGGETVVKGFPKPIKW